MVAHSCPQQQRAPSICDLCALCSIIIYFAVAVVIFFVWHFISDGDFSFLMTLGSLLTLVSFALLVAKVALQKNTSGVSVKALQAFALVFAGRLCSILVSVCCAGAGLLGSGARHHLIGEAQT
jgi:hypothetical protein